MPEFKGSKGSFRTPPWIEVLDGPPSGYHHARTVSVGVGVAPESGSEACAGARSALTVMEHTVCVLYCMLVFVTVGGANLKLNGLLAHPSAKGVRAVLGTSVKVDVEDLQVAWAKLVVGVDDPGFEYVDELDTFLRVEDVGVKDCGVDNRMLEAVAFRM